MLHVLDAAQHKAAASDPADDEAEAAGATSLRPCLSAKPWQVDGVGIGESSSQARPTHCWKAVHAGQIIPFGKP